MKRLPDYPRFLSLLLLMFALLLCECDLFVPVFGVVPKLLLPFTVAVGMAEGPYFGASFGVAAGLFLDHGTTLGYGFSSLLLLVCGVAAGLFIAYFRLSFLTAAFFTLLGGVLTFTLRWFFLYYLWYGSGRFFPIVPLEILYAVLCSVPVFFAVRLLSRRFGSLKHGNE